jgi:transposase
MPSGKKAPRELRDRAVRLTMEARADSASMAEALRKVSSQLGVNRDTLRTWVRQAEIDSGQRPGTTTDEAARIRELEKQVKQLQRSNEILLAASSFFARELDPRLPW